MEIKDLKVYVVGNPIPYYGGFYWIFLKLTADDGVEGFGEVYSVPFNPDTVAKMISDVVERYVIDECVGEGAMGRVYRAHHVRLERRIFAVKILHGELAADPQMRIRFAREALAASRLEHPNVVSVIDFGENPAMSKKAKLYLATTKRHEEFLDKFETELEKVKETRLYAQAVARIDVLASISGRRPIMEILPAAGEGFAGWGGGSESSCDGSGAGFGCTLGATGVAGLIGGGA